MIKILSVKNLMHVDVIVNFPEIICDRRIIGTEKNENRENSCSMNDPKNFLLPVFPHTVDDEFEFVTSFR